MSTPFHSSYANFARFAPSIAAYLRTAPRPWKFNTTNWDLKETTLVARLRDAIGSFRRMRWPNSGLDLEKWDEFAGTMVVLHRSEGVFICDKNHPVNEENPAVSGVAQDELVIDFNEIIPRDHISALKGLIVLCHLRQLVGARLINPPSGYESYAASYDVAFAPNADGSVTLL